MSKLGYKNKKWYTDVIGFNLHREKHYQQRLMSKNIKQSMSRKGNSIDDWLYKLLQLW